MRAVYPFDLVIEIMLAYQFDGKLSRSKLAVA
jgi:hypothetical protein